jgi:hypothetical protein
MEKHLIKKAFLNFIIGLITCSIMGYIFHDLIHGVITGIGVGTGFVIGTVLHKPK